MRQAASAWTRPSMIFFTETCYGLRGPPQASKWLKEYEGSLATKKSSWLDMTEQLTYLERYIGSCLCYLRTVSDREAELESRGVLVVNVFATKQGTWSVKWLWPSALPTSVAACVGGWISSKRPHTLPDRAGVSSGNGSRRHGWIKIEELPVERENQGKLLAFSHDHLLLKQKRFFICSCSQGKV